MLLVPGSALHPSGIDNALKHFSDDAGGQACVNQTIFHSKVCVTLLTNTYLTTFCPILSTFYLIFYLVLPLLLRNIIYDLVNIV